MQQPEGASGIARVRLRIKAADQYLRSGHLSEGQALLQVLLDEVGLSSHDRLSIGDRVDAVPPRARHRFAPPDDDDRERADDERLTARMEVLQQP